MLESVAEETLSNPETMIEEFYYDDLQVSLKAFKDIARSQAYPLFSLSR
jgi:hypothetical protein